jgi:hypothetical protein
MISGQIIFDPSIGAFRDARTGQVVSPFGPPQRSPIGPGAGGY